MRRNEDVIATQIDRLKEVIGKIIPLGTKYALIDFPNYSNVGDSAIWLGEIKLLSQLTGNMPSYVSTVGMFDADEFLSAVPLGPILINGGGNFGDIWRNHQDFREAILEKFKDRLVVQMPQSIKFYDESATARCASGIAAHPNFHLLVRDQQSLEFAQRNFSCPSELVPDAAIALGALNRPEPPSHDIFMLMRTDSERASYDRTPLDLENAVLMDWLDEPARFRKTSYRLARIKSLLKLERSPQQKRLTLYQQLAVGRLKRGLCMLSSGRRVITDRLHAHILSTLLDIPHVALDNNYGKVSGYINAWTKTYPGVQVATTAKEALDKLKFIQIDY